MTRMTDERLRNLCEQDPGLDAADAEEALTELKRARAREARLEAALKPLADVVRAVFEVHHAPSHCALGLSLRVEDGERVLAALEAE